MMHLDEEIIIEMLNRMIGNIHAHGETNHDNLAYDNLMAFDEVLGYMINEIIDEAEKFNSPYFSEKRSGDYALTMLKNLHEYFEDILSSLNEPKEDKSDNVEKSRDFYVSVYYSFENSSPLYRFNTRKEANDFIKHQYKDMLKAIHNDDFADEREAYIEDGFAQIIFDNDTDDMIEWNICEPRNIKEK
ncbi:hypothetical protein [Massilimicrobiota timonensis]|uniref:hypothetical protein n=1 Tax=Massilimicrobiota timonensis TaxID=1776392 RepID=UPI00101DF048|nr:hypothetical protein [Massilimicrobiota timonensis]